MSKHIILFFVAITSAACSERPSDDYLKTLLEENRQTYEEIALIMSDASIHSLSSKSDDEYGRIIERNKLIGVASNLDNSRFVFTIYQQGNEQSGERIGFIFGNVDYSFIIKNDDCLNCEKWEGRKVGFKEILPRWYAFREKYDYSSGVFSLPNSE